MFNKDKCYNGGNKHKFSPRYSEKDSGLAGSGFKVERCFPDDLKKLVTLKVYEGDVCEWCGKVVSRSGR